MQQRKKHRIKLLYENIRFIFFASMARRRFWMLNYLFPKSPDAKSLANSIEEAFQNNKKILDLGCGDRAQALRDLRNHGFNNLYGIDLKPPKHVDGIDLKKASITDTGYEDKFFDGVVFSAYVLPHLSLEDQFKALEEIDRITASGCRGFLGPFNPQVIKTNEIYPDSKNPYLAYVKEKNKSGNGKWQLRRSFMPNIATYSKPNPLQNLIYKQPIPLFSAYFLTGRSIINKLIPNHRVKKDYKERFPFEYYITFVK